MKVTTRLRHTSKSFGVFLASGSFNKQLSMNISASRGNLPSGVSRGAGSLTICCNSSKMLIVIFPPCKLTPLLFRFSFFALFKGDRASDISRESDPGRPGERVPSRSERSESESSDSENGKRPRASSIREMPRDHTSDFTVY